MENMRKLVEKGYDSADYLKAFPIKKRLKPLDKRLFRRLCKLTRKNGRVLDFGCGPGVPYDSYLVSQGYDVVGIDISKKHIEMARKRVPQAMFIKSDFSKVKLASASFDAAISLYAIFHIPRKDHKRLLLKMNRLLKRGGFMLITLGTSDSEYGVEKNWAGAKMAWSSYDSDKNIKMVRDAGFSIVNWAFEGKQGDAEHHLWVLAKKR